MDQRTGGADEDRAVSPVLGVVLMVAITVILATVAATALHDTVRSAEVDAPVGAAVAVDGGDGVTVTWLSNTRAEKLRVEFAADGDRTVVFLRRVGASVRLGQNGLSTNAASLESNGNLDVDGGDEVVVTVTAQKGERRTQVIRRNVTV